MTTVRLVLFCCVILMARAVAARPAPATATRGMLATVHPLATDAGVRAMREGGNAVDAAVAAALVLGVVDGHNSGIGGGCFILLRLADGRIVAIDGRETAPAGATRDMFVRNGKAQSELSKTGPLAVGTPGALAAYEHAAEKFGRRPLKEPLRWAADIAQRGFPLNAQFAARLKTHARELSHFKGSSTALLKPDGRAYARGEVLKQPDLAATYLAIATHGTDWFYKGPFAEKIADWMRDHGGILSVEDFQRYEIKLRKPVVATYRGNTIVGFPPPSSGGVHVAQILNIVENFDLSAMDEPQRSHVIAEAMKLAFADRAHWLGDPDFAKVPRGLVDKQYARQLAGRIDAAQAVKVPGHGTPMDWQQTLFGKHTTHIAAADAEGNWVAITTTVNTSFGSKVIVPGTGVILNNQMDDFSIQPGVPNAFGLVGAEANAIAPAKRPLSSMSPTIVLKDGEPLMTLGAAGGPRIISQVVLAIINYIDRKMPLHAAVAAPRFHHQWLPDRLFVERTFRQPPIEAMTQRGHNVTIMPYAGVLQAIVRTADGKLLGVHDPRTGGKAAGW